MLLLRRGYAVARTFGFTFGISLTKCSRACRRVMRHRWRHRRSGPTASNPRRHTMQSRPASACQRLVAESILLVGARCEYADDITLPSEAPGRAEHHFHALSHIQAFIQVYASLAAARFAWHSRRAGTMRIGLRHRRSPANQYVCSRILKIISACLRASGVL